MRPFRSSRRAEPRTPPYRIILWAGPVAIVQAAIISVITFAVIYNVATRLGLDRHLAATLGAGAWIGSSLADATTFTLMNVVGHDIWIGVRALSCRL